jgi:MMPL family
MNSTPDLPKAGLARRVFWVAGLTAAAALALAPLSFHVERRLDSAVRLEGSESDYVAQQLATRFRSPFVDWVVLVIEELPPLGDFRVIKMLGFTLAVAVLLDATLVRIAIGPALLSLAGDWNRWPGGLAGAKARAAPERIR